jgi:hypothetical protein
MSFKAFVLDEFGDVVGNLNKTHECLVMARKNGIGKFSTSFVTNNKAVFNEFGTLDFDFRTFFVSFDPYSLKEEFL